MKAKRIMAFLAVLVLTFSLAACGGDSGKSSKERNKDRGSRDSFDDVNNDYVISEESNQEYGYNDDEIFGYEYEDDDDYSSYDTYEPDWEWEERLDGTIIIIKYLGSDENVVIPSTLNGKLVTVISDYAFAGNIDVFSVTIPESVISLDSYTNYYTYYSLSNGAFQDCINLENVTFLGDAQLNSNTFKNTPYMEKIISESADSDFIIINNNLVGISNKFISGNVIIPDGVKRICICAFSGCESVNNIVIPDSVNYIGEHAFFKCTNLERVNIPNGVTALNYGCFAECRSLEYLDLPDSIEFVDETAFWGTSYKLTVSYKGNEFADVGGYGMSEFQDYLLFGDNDFIIEDGCLISVRDNIDYIELPDDITSISDFAFFGCSSDMIIVYKGKRYTTGHLATLKKDIAK